MEFVEEYDKERPRFCHEEMTYERTLLLQIAYQLDELCRSRDEVLVLKTALKGAEAALVAVQDIVKQREIEVKWLREECTKQEAANEGLQSENKHLVWKVAQEQKNNFFHEYKKQQELSKALQKEFDAAEKRAENLLRLNAVHLANIDKLKAELFEAKGRVYSFQGSIIAY